MIDKEATECAVALESCLIVFRHDVLAVPIPDFNDITVNEEKKIITRHYYRDKYYTTLRRSDRPSAKPPSSAEVEGAEFGQGVR